MGVILLVGATVVARPAASLPAPQVALRNFSSIDHAADGDLIFRAGHDMVSQIVMAQNDGAQFSHVGLVLKRDGKTMVVHALPSENGAPGGVVVEPLHIFASVQHASSVALYRMPDLRRGDVERIKGYVLSQVGKPFDDDFSMADDSRVYCAELVVRAYAVAGREIGSADTRVSIMTVPEPVVLPDVLSQRAGLVLVGSIHN